MNLIRYDRSFSGFVALALVFALIFATSVAEAQVVGQEETLLDFPEPSHPRYACHDQGVIDEYEKITKDAAFYERLARITGEGDSVIPLLWQWIATARFKNGVELARQGKFAEATLLFDMLDQRFARDESAASGARGEVPSPREWAAAALNNKGAVLARQGRFAEAIAVYDDLIERYGKPHYNEEILAWREELDKQGVDLSELDPNNSVWIRAAVAAARFNKGLALRQQGRLTEALALYDENFDWQEDGLDDCSCAGKDPEGNFLIWQQRLKAQIGKAGIFEQQEKSEEALDLYDKILRQFAMVQRLYPVIPDMLLQEQMIKVVRKRGEVLGKQGEFEREARTYAYLDEILRPGSNLATRQAVFETLLAWAERSRQRDDQKSEFLAYSSLYTLFRNDEDPVIRGPFAKAMIEMGDELAVKKGFVPIKNVVDDIVEVFNRDKDPAIREQVARAILEWASHDDPMTEESIYEAIYEYFGDDREPAIRALVDQALHRLLEEASRLEYRLEQANRSDPDDPIAAIYGRKILLEQANRSDPDDPGYNIAELRAILEERGKEPAEEPEKVDEAPDAESYGWETEQKTESLSLLSPEEADRKLKSILIALLLDAYKMHDAHESIEGYDEIAQRFGDDQDPEVQKQVGRALLHKGKALNHQADKLEEAIAIYDDVAQRFGNDMDVTSALANAAEAALILGRNEEAVQRAKALQAHADADKGDKIIMAFIIWLADPKTPLQHVQKAIQAAGDRTEFHWSFTEVKPFIDNLPKTRKKQAGCFIDYFTQYASKKELQACLKK